MTKYQSFNECGVDTSQYYRLLGTTISEISRATGISRASVTGLAVGKMTEANAELVIPYLEKQNDGTYIAATQECMSEIQKVRTNLREAWKQYCMRESILNEYYRRYGVQRKCANQRKIKIRELIRKHY